MSHAPIELKDAHACKVGGGAEGSNDEGHQADMVVFHLHYGAHLELLQALAEAEGLISAFKVALSRVPRAAVQREHLEKRLSTTEGLWGQVGRKAGSIGVCVGY